jgi:hypothetical protein
MGGWFAHSSISSKYIAQNIRFFIKLQSNKCLHFIFHTIFSFVRRFFWQLTNCLLKNPSILYWAFFWDLTTNFFDILQIVYFETPKLKNENKKGHDYTTEISCLSCPISMVSVLTLAGGYKLFSGLLYWSMISVSGGWMLCTKHKIFNCPLGSLIVLYHSSAKNFVEACRLWKIFYSFYCFAKWI